MQHEDGRERQKREEVFNMKVLFLYPNQRSMSLIPPSIGLFSRLLKDKGMRVDLFDTSSYLIEGIDSDSIQEQNLTARPVKEEYKKIKRGDKDVFLDLNKKIKEFKPDLIAVTTTESTFNLSITLLRSIQQHDLLTLMGGVFTTFAPEKAISYPEIDIVCVGEGEEAIVELCEKIRNGEDYSNVKNLWVKGEKGIIAKNQLRPPTDINSLPPLDCEIFDENRLYRMMGGKIYKMLPIETHRGCPYQCGYCDSPAQNKLYWDNTHCSFVRKKSMTKIHEDIVYNLKKFKADYIFFWADTFFIYTDNEIDEFCDMYKDIKLPFYAQARPETITEYKLKRLKEVGLHRLGVGIEHGNEEFRKRILNRHYSNKQVIDSLNLVHKLNIPFSVNNIIGLPDETPQLVMDTIELNRQIPSSDCTCSIFQPYHGTKLREYSIQQGYITEDVIAPTNSDFSILTMPNFPKEKIAGMRRTFRMYITFPKDRWNDIRLAEQFTEEGNKKWEELHEEFIKTYFKEE